MTMTITHELAPRHREHLRASAISDEVMQARGYITILPGAVKDALELPGMAHSATKLKQALHQGALAFPVYRVGSDTPTTWVLRPDLPRTDRRGKVIKYEWPQGFGNLVDVLPHYRDALGDPSIPIWFTEGAKKADALASAFGNAIVPVDLNGVFGFRGRNERGGKVVLPDFQEFALNGREVVLAYDSDVKTNKNIRLALGQLSRWLIAKGAQIIRLLILPDADDGSKQGVDDYLAAGNSPESLFTMFSTMDAVQAAGIVPLCAHPDTGAKMYLPPGYDVQQQSIVRMGPRGDFMPVYSGFLFVQSLGIDMSCGDEAVTLRWDGATRGLLSVTREEMANARALRDKLSARGALIHDGNAKEVTRYLAEFIRQNVDDLPRVAVTSRLGIHGDTLVLPQGSIGDSGPIMYHSVRPIECGDDAGAYRAALAEMATWDDFGSIPALVLAMAFASPMIARIHPRRNPALYLAGPSGSGKTTLAQFAVGAWGDPTVAPFRIEATRTTQVGYQQTLTHLGGLPLFVDEAHTAHRPELLETLAYNFANGQSYTRGTVTGQTAGGEPMSGSLILAGEAHMVFRNSGSKNRVLWLDGHMWSPMGTDDPEAGKRHAAMLEQSWESGSGLFGAQLAEAAWRDWETFVGDVDALRLHEELAAAPTAWQHVLAIGMAALRLAFDIASIELGDVDVAAMLGQWSGMLMQGHADNDPATDAFESLVLLLTGAESILHASPGWQVRGLHNEPIAYMREGEDVWRIPTRTDAITGKLGPNAVQLYGQVWANRGWIERDDNGRCSYVMRIGHEGVARCIRVPAERLADWGGDVS